MEYDEIPAGVKDWEFGKDVVIHAAGRGGENIWLRVVKGQELESVKLIDAAMRMR